MLVIGHRGARGLAPENTLASFERALAAGAPWVELDVQWHAEKLWVLHDLRLDRTTSGHGRLIDHDAAALHALDAGGGQKIPFLEEVLDAVNARAGVNVELKTAGGTATAVAALLEKYLARGWPAEKLQVSSFDLRELREFRKRLPQVPIGVLLAGVPLDLAAAASALEADVVSLALDYADPLLIADAKRRGCRVYVYTVNHADDAQRLRAMGVDGIFTDFPDRFLGASR